MKELLSYSKEDDFIERDDVQEELAQLLLKRRRESLELLKKYGLVSKGKNNNYNNLGIDDLHIQDAYKNLPDKLKRKAKLLYLLTVALFDLLLSYEN